MYTCGEESAIFGGTFPLRCGRGALLDAVSEQAGLARCFSLWRKRLIFLFSFANQLDHFVFRLGTLERVLVLFVVLGFFVLFEEVTLANV
jgi:hypothetical protein